MTEDEEQSYLDGHRSEDPAARVGWIHEREAVIAVLRRLCRDFGDNDWDADLNLADVIDKHLGVHLYTLLSTLADGRPIRELLSTLADGRPIREDAERVSTGVKRAVACEHPVSSSDPSDEWCRNCDEHLNQHE